MNSLRSRIALVLVISIVAVVGLATSATVFVLGQLGPENLAKPIALQIAKIIPLLTSVTSDPASSVIITNMPAAGAPREPLADFLKQMLLELGYANQIIVTKPTDSDWLTVSIEVPSRGWFSIPIADEPPRGAWIALVGWMALIVGGSLAIALGVAHRIARPLAMLEGVTSDISRSGEMAALPETGPAEVRATARALNRLTANLRTAMESRMRLVAAAGHDLRTPITRMRLRAEFLPEHEKSAWLRDLDEMRHIADSSIQLVYEEIEDHSDNLVRLDKLTTAVAEELKTTGLDVTVVRLDQVIIQAMPLAITRVLRNLLSNAATHGVRCEVSVEAHAEQAVIVIEDSGPGIPEAVIRQVFEPFFRVDSARQQPIPGAGLGLAIAREIILRYSGEITLNNRAQGGLRQELRFRSVDDPGVN